MLLTGGFTLDQLARKKGSEKPKGFYKQGGRVKPITEKKGIKESDMRISVQGNNDRISVGTVTEKKLQDKIHDNELDKFNHDTYLGIRSMLARYGSMSIDGYGDIFYDLEGLTEKQKKQYFDELVRHGFIKEIKVQGKTQYESVPEKESSRVREIAKSDETTYFDELEKGNSERIRNQ